VATQMETQTEIVTLPQVVKAVEIVGPAHTMSPSSKSHELMTRFEKLLMNANTNIVVYKCELIRRRVMTKSKRQKIYI